MSLPGSTRPRQEELAGKDKDPGKRSLPGRTKTPARGSCREGQPRHFRKLAATPRASRQGPVGGKLAGATRQTATARCLPRQGCLSAPKLQRIQRRVTPGLSQEHVARRCAAMRCEVASEADKEAIVAIGGAPNGRFLHCWSDQTGIKCSCPLPSELGRGHCR